MWVQGFKGDSPQRGASIRWPRSEVTEARGLKQAKGVLWDTWVTTLQKSPSIFHHTELFGASQCEVKHRAFIFGIQLFEITAP